MKIKIKEMFLDEWIRLNEFIGKNYDKNTKKHLAYISDIESVGLTDTYKGKKGDMHQVYKGIVLHVKNDIPDDKLKELKSIIGC